MKSFLKRFIVLFLSNSNEKLHVSMKYLYSSMRHLERCGESCESLVKASWKAKSEMIWRDYGSGGRTVAKNTGTETVRPVVPDLPVMLLCFFLKWKHVPHVRLKNKLKKNPSKPQKEKTPKPPCFPRWCFTQMCLSTCTLKNIWLVIGRNAYLVWSDLNLLEVKCTFWLNTNWRAGFPNKIFLSGKNLT